MRLFTGKALNLQEHLKRIKTSRTYATGKKIVAVVVLIGGLYSGVQAIEHYVQGETIREKAAYNSVSIGKSSVYIESLFGNPIISSDMDILTYKVFETKNTFFTGIYDNDSLIGFFVFLKDGSKINLPYKYFPDALGKFRYSDITSPAQKYIIDVGNGNMGYALYEEFHGSGRWGYYYDYIIGECSIGKCKQGKQGMLQLFSPPDAGEYKNEDFPFLTDDLYFQTRNKSYPNFAGVVKYGYKVDYPTIDSYLTICGTKK